jgi:flagellar basal-body rod protein FlgB
MIDALFSEPNYVATKKLLDATALRQEAIASNLANLETPNYKRVDLAPSFNSELERAMGTSNSEAISSLKPALMVDGTATAENRDGNTVQLETELVNLNQNSFAHAMETQMVTSSLLKLRMAITGSV